MKRLFLMGFFALSCSGSGKGYYSESNLRIDTGDLYGADSSAKNISWECIPCEVNISLSVVGR